MTTKDAIGDAIAALIPVYVNHAAGCCWHILTDDGNVEREHLEFCVEYAREHQHPACVAAIDPIQRLSPTQREQLYDRYDEYAKGIGVFRDAHTVTVAHRKDRR